MSTGPAQSPSVLMPSALPVFYVRDKLHSSQGDPLWRSKERNGVGGGVGGDLEAETNRKG